MISRCQRLRLAAASEGKKNEAIEMLRRAADAEDILGKHPVSPGAFVPIREQLGNLLLEVGQPKEAQVEFEAALKINPGRFRGCMERPELSTGLFVGIVRERLEFVYEESKPHSFSPPGGRRSNLGADIQSTNIEAWYRASKFKVPKSEFIQIGRNQIPDPRGILMTVLPLSQSKLITSHLPMVVWS